MKDAIRAEFLKLRTTRTVYTLGLGMLGLVGLLVAVSLWGPAGHLMRPLLDQEFVFAPGQAMLLFVLLLGLRSFTDELRHGSIVPTLLTTPDRRRVLGAKVVAVACVSLGFAVAAYGLALAMGLPWLAAKGVHVTVPIAGLAALLGKAWLSAVLWAALGVGLGLAIRRQVAAIVWALVWLMLVEGLVSSLLPAVSKFLPLAASAALTGGAGRFLAPAAGAAVLALWAAAAVTAGAVRMRAMDVA